MDEENSDDRRQQPEGTRDERKQHHADDSRREAHPGAFRRRGESRPEDHRADVLGRRGLEQVRAAAGAVADVVSDEVRDHRRVARIILGDPRLDLSNQVGANVGRLRVDAAAQLREESNKGRTKPVPDNQERDLGRRDLGEVADEPVESPDAEERHRVQKASRSAVGTGSKSWCERTKPYSTKIRPARIAARKRIVVFCRRRNASAPSLIAFEISRIAGVPVSRLRTHEIR